MDFLIAECRLAIELDGDTHASDAARAYDERRDAWLEKQGIHVLRFTNREVAGNLDGVLAAIAAAARHPHPNRLPEGEGEDPPAPTPPSP